MEKEKLLLLETYSPQINNIKKKKSLNIKEKMLLFCIIFIQQVLIIYFYLNYYRKINNKVYIETSLDIFKEYENNTFIIIKKPCRSCGLFSFYKAFLNCIEKVIIKGHIPIIELQSTPNIFNGHKPNNSSLNPWELFFNQSFGFKLANVKKKAKKIKYLHCNIDSNTPQYKDIYIKNIAIEFWHNIAKKYMPINEKIIKETNIIINKLFKGSYNILGILIRGTDYLARKPKNHPIPPNSKRVIKDINEMDKNNGYDWIYLVTEDHLIRKKFIKIFYKKLKYLSPKNNIEYDYKEKNFLGYNKNINGNLENIKLYLINIIILSKCLDIITARTNGSIGAFILSEGYRNIKVYYLGTY